jgi:RNA polymerase sigma factor (sigma-70 family)
MKTKKSKSTFNSSDELDLQVLKSVVTKKDPRAYEHIVNKYHQFIYIKVVKTGIDEDTAKDVCQEIFIKIHDNLVLYKKEYTLNAWITRMANNYLIDVIRKRKLVPELKPNNIHLNDLNHRDDEDLNYRRNKNEFAISDIVDTEAAPFDELNYEKLHSEKFRKVTDALKSFKEIDKRILVKFYLERIRSRRIAEELGVPHSTVRVKLLRARKKLRIALGVKNEKLFKTQGEIGIKNLLAH